MHPEVKNIAHRALNLPASARASLAEILLESLEIEEDFSVTDEWLKEIHRRCQQIDDGEVEMMDGEAAIASIRRKYEAL